MTATTEKSSSTEFLDESAPASACANPLKALAGVLETATDLPPKQPFRRSDPVEAARAGAGEVGSETDAFDECMDGDIEGLEEERPLNPVTASRKVIGVDAGVAHLGKLPDGHVVAYRAAAYSVQPDGTASVRLYRPGVCIVTAANQLELLHTMGAAMGRPDFYVSLEGGQPVAEKRASHTDRVVDRIRNCIERVVQLDVCRCEKDALIALDGSLTRRTHDTPGSFIEDLGALCAESGSSLVGVSKSTRLTLGGREITDYLNRSGRPGRRRLTMALRKEAGSGNSGSGESRALGDVFVVRFAPGGLGYRVDIAPTPGMAAAEGIDEFVGACRQRCGYPEPLVRAHFDSYFTPPVIAELQSFAIAKYDLDVVAERRLAPIFAPFGGRFK